MWVGQICDFQQIFHYKVGAKWPFIDLWHSLSINFTPYVRTINTSVDIAMMFVIVFLQQLSFLVNFERVVLLKW